MLNSVGEVVAVASRFVPNQRGIRQLGRSQQMQAAMGHIAEIVRINAERIAPVRTGHYAFDRPNPRAPESAGAFHVSSGVARGVAYGRVTNSTVYARYLEFGTRYMGKQRVLGRALDAVRSRG